MWNLQRVVHKALFRTKRRVSAPEASSCRRIKQASTTHQTTSAGLARQCPTRKPFPDARASIPRPARHRMFLRECPHPASAACSDEFPFTHPPFDAAISQGVQQPYRRHACAHTTPQTARKPRPPPAHSVPSSRSRASAGAACGRCGRA
jgi:hypothetical protein